MGPKLMNGCKPEQMGTKEYGNMIKWIQVLEDGQGPRQRRQEAGRLKDKREELREKCIRGFCKQVRNRRFHGAKKDC